MGDPGPVNFTSSQLFGICAADPRNEECWAEFIRRYNPLLTRSVITAWRKRCQGGWPSSELLADLLQDIYAVILKNDCQMLRGFRGKSEAEAEAYLAHTAINTTISHLRFREAEKRKADLVSIDDLSPSEQGREQFMPNTSASNSLVSESELIEALRQIISGPNSRRDILIFLLHVCDGWTAAEISRMGICDLKETSIANLLVKMKARVKHYYLTK
jgi:DNA-directed RNA polymerase specialized sigma24 family protein